MRLRGVEDVLHATPSSYSTPPYYSISPDRKRLSKCLSTSIRNEFHYLIVITDWSRDKFQSYPLSHLVTPTQSHTSSPPFLPHPPSPHFLHPPSPHSSLSTTILSLWVPPTFYRPLFLPPSISLYYTRTRTLLITILAFTVVSPSLPSFYIDARLICSTPHSHTDR